MIGCFPERREMGLTGKAGAAATQGTRPSGQEETRPCRNPTAAPLTIMRLLLPCPQYGLCVGVGI